ncbi:MAG: AsmA family protein [Proteobacteria bacterium]|nr:AsmA family protein [Pseudomonadota bacterium]
MKRFAKILGWTLGVLVALVGVAVGGSYLYLTSTDFRSLVESQASSLSGRKTRIEKVTVDWSTVPHIHLSGVQVANADWAKTDYMLKADHVDFTIRLWPLLKGDVVLPHLSLQKPEVIVEKGGPHDELNWSFGESSGGTAAEAVKPNNRFQTPLVGRLEVTEGKIAYRDPKRKLSLDGTISTAMGKAGRQPQAELKLQGKLEGQPLTVNFTGGSAIMLRDTRQPYPIDLEVAFGATRLTAKGQVQDPFQWADPDVDLTLSGPNLDQIYPLLGIPGPPTAPYRISGKLERDPGVWKFVKTQWRVGDSDLAGDISVDERKKPGFLTARLVSSNLAFKDLAPLVGAAPSSGTMNQQQAQTQQQLRARGELFPNIPLHVEKLRAMNMDVTLDARKVVAPDYLPVQALSFRVLVNNGVAEVNPISLALIGSGRISGELGLDARTDTPRVHANLVGTGIELKTFFRNSKFFDTTQGAVQGHVNLAGTGRSLAHVMGSATGDVELAMAGGSISSLMVSEASLQLFDALILFVTGDHRIPILCAAGRMNFQDGTITFDRTLLDTQKSILHVDGTVGLQNQAVNVQVKADPKSFDLLDLHGPVGVIGKIRNPQVSLGRVFPIPTPTIGTAKTVNCPALTQQLLGSQAPDVARAR